MQEQDADRPPQTPQPAPVAIGPEGPPEPDATPLDLDAIEAKARAAEAEAPSPWHQGYAWKHSVLCPYPEGLGGPAGGRVILRANEHFPHEATIAHVGGMDPATTLRLCAALREARSDARFFEVHARSGVDDLAAAIKRAEKAEAIAKAERALRIAAEEWCGEAAKGHRVSAAHGRYLHARVALRALGVEP